MLSHLKSLDGFWNQRGKDTLFFPLTPVNRAISLLTKASSAQLAFGPSFCPFIQGNSNAFVYVSNIIQVNVE